MKNRFTRRGFLGLLAAGAAVALVTPEIILRPMVTVPTRGANIKLVADLWAQAMDDRIEEALFRNAADSSTFAGGMAALITAPKAFTFGHMPPITKSDFNYDAKETFTSVYWRKFDA